MPSVILHQFPFSHFNEKARWGLAWKGVAYTRASHLPGPHKLALHRLSGQSQTPVLVWDGHVVVGSAAILAHLERTQPEPALLPEDPEQRAAALALQARFDEVVGPATRAALFSVLLEVPEYLCRMFLESRPRWQRALYRGTFPIVKPVMAKGNGVDTKEAIRRAFTATDDALAEIESSFGCTNHLVGDRFSVADLTAASLLAPLVDLEHPDMKHPLPRPAVVEDFLSRYRDRPAAAWVRQMYEKHRPPIDAAFG